MKKFLNLLDRPITIHRCLIEITGSLTAGLYLTQAVYWQKRLTNESNPWWHKSQIEWTDETSLSRREQDTARKRLVQLGILEVRRAGMPARLLYRVNQSRLTALLSARSLSTREDKVSAQDPVELIH